MKDILEVIVPGVVSCVIAFFALRIAANQIKERGLNSLTMQLFALALFLPTVIIVSGLGEFEGDGLATIMGSFVGYLFGKHTTPSD